MAGCVSKPSEWSSFIAQAPGCACGDLFFFALSHQSDSTPSVGKKGFLPFILALCYLSSSLWVLHFFSLLRRFCVLLLKKQGRARYPRLSSLLSISFFVPPSLSSPGMASSQFAVVGWLVRDVNAYSACVHSVGRQTALLNGSNCGP